MADAHAALQRQGAWLQQLFGEQHHHGAGQQQLQQQQDEAMVLQLLPPQQASLVELQVRRGLGMESKDCR